MFQTSADQHDMYADLFPLQPHWQQQQQLGFTKQLEQLQQQQQPQPAWSLYYGFPAELAAAEGRSAAAYAPTGVHSRVAFNGSSGSSSSTSDSEAGSSSSVMELPGSVAADAHESDSTAHAAAADEQAGSSRRPRRRTSSSYLDEAEEQQQQQEQRAKRSDETWQRFLAAALVEQQAAAVRPKVDEAGSQVDQRTDAWLSLREGRLTGSALCAVLDWFRGKGKTSEAARLWLQKLKLAPPTAANEAMAYGTHSEPLAMAAYQGLAPHEQLTALGLRVWRDDEVHGWLAASPDGLITVGTANGAAGLSAAEADWLRQQAGVSGEGVLEIKCPHKALKGKLPAPQEYYMPQVQMLCEVLQREWAVLYYWSGEHGSHMSLIHRDRDYFALLWQAMSDFWWQHVQPAQLLLQHASPQLRQRLTEAYAAAEAATAEAAAAAAAVAATAVAAGDAASTSGSSSEGDAAAPSAEAHLRSIVQSDPELAQLVDQLEALRPRRVHPYAAEIKRRSKELLRAAPKRQFSADETKRAGIAAMDGAAAQ